MSKLENIYEVVMPKLGLIMTEAMLVEWHKGNQEWVEQGELLFSLESEKTIIDIEAPTSGYVQILVQAEEIVSVMTPVALISPEPGEIEVPASAEVETTQLQERTTPGIPERTIPQEAGQRASPKARHLARQRNLPLAGIDGTGPRGMVVAADLDTASASTAEVKVSPVVRNMAADYQLDLAAITGTGPNGMVTREDIARTIRDLATGVSSRHQQTSPASHLSGLRGIIAERLTESWQQRPQVTLHSQMDASALVADRERRKAAGNTISYNTYLIKASAMALMDFPQLNVYLTPEQLIQHEEINIGLAVDTDRGLMVPVLKDVPARPIQDLNQELLDLVERSLSGQLLPEEYSGGSFTVTNLGAFGVDSFSPIINPPESAILGVGRIIDQPIIQDGEVQGQKALTLSLSFDHRIIDGAPAAQFLARIVEILQDPAQLEKF